MEEDWHTRTLPPCLAFIPRHVLTHAHTDTPNQHYHLPQLLQKHGLTPSDFQKLVLRFQGEPRIAQALQRSQTQQAEALARMGLPV